jgi:hypothetical protein
VQKNVRLSVPGAAGELPRQPDRGDRFVETFGVYGGAIWAATARDLDTAVTDELHKPLALPSM